MAKELDERWYFNVETNQAEKGPAKRGFLESRIGPYETQAEAERGLTQLHERNKRLDDEDKRWNDS